jgi:ParB family chromosome partitioning protein
MNVVYANVALGKLVESALNYRRHYDEAKLAELAANIKTIGIRSPLLVRPLVRPGEPWVEEEDGDLIRADYFEIASGHRRYRAAKLAGLEAAPCVIQCMTDDAFIETLSVEILQHEDVHPLDEAAGYRELLKRPGYDAAVIAARTGKEVLYIQRRLSLLRLIGEAHQAFMAGSINLAMAQIVARLTPMDQKAAVAKLLVKDTWGEIAIRSSRQLQRWVAEELMLSLGKAPFNVEDPDLVPGAGVCRECPKRTGFMPELFPEIEDRDTCTDRHCYAAKKNAYLVVRIGQMTAEARGAEPILLTTVYEGAKPELYAGRPVLARGRYTEVKKSKKPACEYQKTALVVRGLDGVGRTIEVCTNQRCPVHGLRRGVRPQSDAEREKREKELFEETVDERTRLVMIDHTAKAFDTRKVHVEDFRMLAALAFWKLGNSDARRAISRARTGKEEGHMSGETSEMRLWIGKAKSEELFRLIFEGALYEHLIDYDGKDELSLAAERWGVDGKKIRLEIERELCEERKAAADQAAKRVAEKEKKAGRGKAAVEARIERVMSVG